MKRGVLIILLIAAGGFLAGCSNNPIDRWLGIDGHDSPAPAPAPAPVPPAPPASPTPVPAPPRFETYHFEGTVKSGGTRYYGAIAPGDAVDGTFRIDFDQPLFYQNGTTSLYEAFVHIEGTVGGYAFSGENNLIYVDPNVVSPFHVDTGNLTLDGQRISFDFYFFGGGAFSDSALSNLRRLDRRAYTGIDLWFETFPGFGEGFNADIVRLTYVAG